MRRKGIPWQGGGEVYASNGGSRADDALIEALASGLTVRDAAHNAG